jgi:drug/metabolite transporter (DMT)-like permease
MSPPLPNPNIGLSLGQRLAPYSLLVALVLVVIWGCNFPLQKFVFNSISPNGVLLVRYGVLMPLCSVALLLLVFGRRWPALTRADAFILFKLGFIGHLVHVGLVTHGMNLSTPFSSSLMIACGPIFTLLLLRFMVGESLQRGPLFGVFVAFVGILVFMSEKLFLGRWSASAGDLLLLLAASIRPLIERLGNVPTMAYTTLLSCPPIVLVAALGGGWQGAWSNVPTMAWLSLAYGVIISAFMGWVIWGWVNQVRGVARSAPLSYLMAPVAGLVSWLSGGEVFSSIKIGGAMLALAGVAFAQFAAHDPRVEGTTGE